MTTSEKPARCARTGSTVPSSPLPIRKMSTESRIAPIERICLRMTQPWLTRAEHQVKARRICGKSRSEHVPRRDIAQHDDDEHTQHQQLEIFLQEDAYRIAEPVEQRCHDGEAE